MPTITRQTNNLKKPMPKKGVGVLNRIVDLEDLEEVGIKLALYGTSGSGKTRFACTFPKPLLVIGSERGMKSVKGDKGIRFVKLSASAELDELLPACADMGLKTVFLDTGTMLQDLVLAEILGWAKLPEQKSWGMATREQYGSCIAITKEYFRKILNLADLGINVVVACQETNYNSMETGDSDVLKPSIGSALSPKLAGWLHPACDYVGQMYKRRKISTKTVSVGGKATTIEVDTGDKEFCLRTGIHEIYATKFRVPRGQELPECIVDPTFDKVMELINGEA